MLTAIWSYIENALPFIVISLPLLIICRVAVNCFYAHRKTSVLRCVNFAREICIIIFSLYAVGLASQTVIPKLVWEDRGFVIAETLHFTKYNFIAFVSIIDCIEKIFLHQNMYYVIFLFGNIFIFAPIGCFCGIMMKKDKYRLLKAVCISCAVSVFIETVQIFLDRMVDVDDVILNTLGGFIGYLLCICMEKIFPGFRGKFRKYNE